MTRQKLLPLFACLILGACASGPSPEDAQMASNMCAQGKTLLASGKYTEARDIYASAVQRDDENARAWNGLGVSYDMLGKKADALDALQRAAELAPNDVTVANNLAHINMETGDAEGAARLLQPYAADPGASKTLKENLAKATAASRAQAEKKGEDAGEIYADLGAYPTEGMAQGHIGEAKELIGDEARGLKFSIVPDVKVGGGTPVFTVRVTGRSPQALCAAYNAVAFPCIPHGK